MPKEKNGTMDGTKKAPPKKLATPHKIRLNHFGGHTLDQALPGTTGRAAVIVNREEDVHYIETKSGFHGFAANGMLLPTGEIYDSGAELTKLPPPKTQEELDDEAAAREEE